MGRDVSLVVPPRLPRLTPGSLEGCNGADRPTLQRWNREYQVRRTRSSYCVLQRLPPEYAFRAGCSGTSSRTAPVPTPPALCGLPATTSPHSISTIYAFRETIPYHGPRFSVNFGSASLWLRGRCPPLSGGSRTLPPRGRGRSPGGRTIRPRRARGPGRRRTARPAYPPARRWRPGGGSG